MPSFINSQEWAQVPGLGVGDSQTLPQADRAGLLPSSYTALALGKLAGDPGPIPFLSLQPPSPFPYLAPGCASYTPAKPESGDLPSWGHLSPQRPQSLQKLGEGRGWSEAGMSGFLPRTCWNWAPPVLTPPPTSHRHDQRSFRGWPPWLGSPAGHWPRDPPAPIPWSSHSRGSGECSSRA